MTHSDWSNRGDCRGVETNLGHAPRNYNALCSNPILLQGQTGDLGGITYVFTEVI